MEKVKLKVRKVLIVLLVFWMIVVFCLSHQSGNSSSNLSIKTANFFADGNTQVAENIEPVVRKVAHMLEYAIGSMLCYGLLLTYPKYSRKARIIIALAFIILYATTDEFHQSFINNRNGTPWDVLIDTFGGAVGIGAVYIIEVAICIMDNKIKEELQNPKLNR